MKLGVVLRSDGTVFGDIMSPTAEGFGNAMARVPDGFMVIEVSVDLDPEQASAVQKLGNNELSMEELRRISHLIRLGIQMGIEVQKVLAIFRIHDGRRKK
ncbi:MAG: hypothetical protein NUW02_00760 [Candidatus Campbellbacteria bacterium]|nr:hypothetical protein [Candidatus Campbellbacteria bacterium]